MRDVGYLRKGKAMRKGKVSLGIIVTFFVGVIVGMAISISIGAVLSYIDPGTFLTRHPKTFGDIKIWAKKSPSIEDEESYNASKVLVMTKDDVPFLSVHQNKVGKVEQILITEGTEKIRFSMDSSDEPSKWEHAKYASYNHGYITGDMFFDINFDGQFDGKYFYDDAGELISKHIYLDKAWRKVERLEKGKAILDQKTYVFSDDSGWVIHK